MTSCPAQARQGASRVQHLSRVSVDARCLMSCCRRGPNVGWFNRNHTRPKVTVCRPGFDTANPVRPLQARFVACALASISNGINHLHAESVELEGQKPKTFVGCGDAGPCLGAPRPCSIPPFPRKTARGAGSAFLHDLSKTKFVCSCFCSLR